MSICPVLMDHFRCDDRNIDFQRFGEDSANPGYFRFGEDTICYGRVSVGFASDEVSSELVDLARQVEIRPSLCLLPFDPSSIVDNLRLERYAAQPQSKIRQPDYKDLIHEAYYLIRPILPVAVRKHFQRFSLRGWRNLAFPQWPVDTTTEKLCDRLMLFLLKARRVERIPFVWFWPEGKSACAIMTHDVEAKPGLRFCDSLMDLDEQYGIKSSFQLIPGGRYQVSDGVLTEIRSRSFEVNVHDWNHDGQLFVNHKTFLERAVKINDACARFQADGFRSGVLYRNTDWFDSFAFSYDMSIPNVAHLDPQKGGCCTVMPYFIGRILELPLTMTQDYSLFHILNDYSIDLWRHQAEAISDAHGLISANIHPDYVIDTRARDTYHQLLAYIESLAAQRNIWLALPGEVNRWWRERAEMRIVENEGQLSIEGDKSGRARIAYAYCDGANLAYEWAQ